MSKFTKGAKLTIDCDDNIEKEEHKDQKKNPYHRLCNPSNMML